MTQIERIMGTTPIIPVIVINKPEEAVPMAQALVVGGLKVLEVTLRTSHGLDAISRIKEEVPGAIVGAGTVLNERDLDNSLAAGAEFLVSPGCTPALAKAAQAAKAAFLPGVATASEAMQLMEMGFTHLKFFPAEASGGRNLLKALYGPLPQVRFCPTGGVGPANAADYLALENVLCVGGSWMMDKMAIANKDWQQLEAAARSAVALFNS